MRNSLRVGMLGISLTASATLARAQDSLAGAPRAKAALNMPGYRWRYQRTPNADIYILAASAAESRSNWVHDAVERDL